MIRDKESESIDPIDRYSKVIDKILAVEEVVGGEQEIPGERSEPRQTVNSVHAVTDRNYFLETFYLHK